MEYMQLSLDDYIQCKNDIKNNLGTIVKSFVRIGWQLSRIDKSGAYKNDGYNTIAEFAKAEYGMSATGTSRFIRVYEKYSVPGDTPELRDEYKDYNRSQLEEMLQIPEEDHEMIRPEAHKEDIRELNRFNRENESNPDNLLDWKNAQTTEEKIQATIYEFWHDNRDAMNTFFGSDMEMRDLAEMISPSGSRSYRKGTVFLMFYGMDTEILVKVFGDDPVKMTYQEFADRTRQIFEGAAGDRAWETCFGEAVESNKIEQTEQLQEQEDQIPGQDRIQNHPEYMPEPEIAPAQKNEEQKYNKQQARIDRETKKKLQEQEDQEKMEHLPSDEPKKTKQLRMAASYYDDVLSGKMSFWFCKNDNFHVGDSLDLMEFKEGRHTGRNIQTEITYILEDYTGLEDGYCILAIKVTGAI
ncbi:hypothetical protein RUMOBE_00949 [Blautia obeum ATCC 29174]|jgi:hypothetical protein|uniref:DUF3850 domain-containing protein n=2 Tax=Blautia obeum TaxID=40520 RepID=A5ZPN2_9FIRM|nr:DUF3850 domain-containing protein [Blautia obeum]EDM88828.1 hypothetical protein RUMOBE_00949 [Blautia obeum ATCC 29174]RHH19553.1 DUF3850 domain-containing protein [Blautia obeum]UWO14561.1 DUF3850 domain-containing protein [Blautia obeum ATCC 29174]